MNGDFDHIDQLDNDIAIQNTERETQTGPTIPLVAIPVAWC